MGRLPQADTSGCVVTNLPCRVIRYSEHGNPLELGVGVVRQPTLDAPAFMMIRARRGTHKWC